MNSRHTFRKPPEVIVTFICDDCLHSSMHFHLSYKTRKAKESELVEIMKLRGWAIRETTIHPFAMGYSYCPECAKKRGLKNE